MCYECAAGYEWNWWGECVPVNNGTDCKENEFFDWDTNKCTPCHSSCRTCQNADYCFDCQDGFVLFDRLCVEICFQVITNKYGTW
mmetsp:Transcript_18050/g.13091  ORF Transcript_18050/g.13091 Transcript_18050/m.13091 type:complete len:85 (-) Transcript_18050:3513-3767(-)